MVVVLLVLERAEETFKRSNAYVSPRCRFIENNARVLSIIAPAHEDVLRRRVGVVASELAVQVA